MSSLFMLTGTLLQAVNADATSHVANLETCSETERREQEEIQAYLQHLNLMEKLRAE
ncbi:MAG: hypothetical protein H7252_05835 [Cytophaga sp.]|nr:hypothetical protein [Undibacterium sp.]